MIRRYYNGVKGGRIARFFMGTFISDDSSQVTYQANLYGMPTAILTVKVVYYVNTNNNGKLRVNTAIVFLSNTFTVALDATGRGSFIAQIEGNASDFGTVVLGQFEIISSTIGSVTTNSARYWQTSKTF